MNMYGQTWLPFNCLLSPLTNAADSTMLPPNSKSSVMYRRHLTKSLGDQKGQHQRVDKVHSSLRPKSPADAPMFASKMQGVATCKAGCNHQPMAVLVTQTQLKWL